VQCALKKFTLSDNPTGGLTLPSTTFNGKRGSFIAHKQDSSAGGEEFLIPLAFDPTPPAVQSPPNQEIPKLSEERPRDYFSRSQQQSQQPPQKISSPHITSQLQAMNKSQHSSSDTLRNRRDDSATRKESTSSSTFISPDHPKRQPSASSQTSQVARTGNQPEEKFKLEQAPNTKRLQSAKDTLTPSSLHDQTTALPQDPTEDLYSPQLTLDSPISESSPRPLQHPAVLAAASLPKRGDSLDRAKMASSNQTNTIPRKEVNTANVSSSLASPTGTGSTSDSAKVNGGKVISAPVESPTSRSIYDTPSLPPSSRAPQESFVEPRSAPMPPPGAAKGRRPCLVTRRAATSPWTKTWRGSSETRKAATRS
jgi:Rho-type GTPase-activating protein 1/2